MSDLFPPVQQFLRGQAPLSSVEQAIKEGADLNQWEGPQTPLKCAIQAYNAPLLQCLLLGKANPNKKDLKGVTPLHVAVFEGKGEEVRVLLDAAADVNATDRHGQTALFFAPSRHICEILISRDADINIKNIKHQSALHLAAYAGLNDTVAWLAQKADKDMLDAKDKNGNSAVYYAAHAKVKSTVAVLQSKGADVSVKSRKDKVRFAKSIAAAAMQPSVAEDAPLPLPAESAAAEGAVADQAAQKAAAEKEEATAVKLQRLQQPASDNGAAEKVPVASPDAAADTGVTPLPAKALPAAPRVKLTRAASNLETVLEEDSNLEDSPEGSTAAVAQPTDETISSADAPLLQQPQLLEGSECDLQVAGGERSVASSQLPLLLTDPPLPKQTVVQIKQDDCLFWQVVLLKEDPDEKYGFVQANGRLEFKQRLEMTNQTTNNTDNSKLQVSNNSTPSSSAPNSPGRSIGEDLSIAGPEVLIVRKVNEDGLLGVWNRQHPWAEVRAQDRIVSVNGETTVEGMQYQIRSLEIRIKLCRYPERFTVTLSKEEGQKRLGFRFERPTNQHSQELRISEVLKEGALPDFNARQGELGLWHFAVLPDMRIERANDVAGDACEMAEELKRCENVTLQIRRAEAVLLTHQQVRSRLQLLSSSRSQQQQQQLRPKQQEVLTGKSRTSDYLMSNADDSAIASSNDVSFSSATEAARAADGPKEAPEAPSTAGLSDGANGDTDKADTEE